GTASTNSLRNQGRQDDYRAYWCDTPVPGGYWYSPTSSGKSPAYDVLTMRSIGAPCAKPNVSAAVPEAPIASMYSTPPSSSRRRLRALDCAVPSGLGASGASRSMTSQQAC